MANFNKAFNFRGGFQVDTDVLIVRGQNVGIGSTIPSERLDVNGIIKANGLEITSSESVNLAEAQAGILTVTDILDVGIEAGSALPYPQGTPQVRLTTGIITAANPAIGVVTYYGDGGRLLNLPTSQWLDVDVGLGFTSIYAQGYVGVDTTDPRYVFQVGGVPFAPKAGFNTTQDGLGIEDGALYATGILTTASDVGAAGTIYAGTEFIGVGSNISILNADNIAIGSIGSMRYGSLIVTEEVIADRFTGIASTAVDVLPTSQLVFDTARANDITAVNRFISTEGRLVIGHNDFPTNNSLVGNIDVREEGRDSTIYSLTSEGDTARIFAGLEREGGGRNGFGGIRFGGSVSGSPTSGLEDLDVVNYDVGNLNFVLHDGNTSGGTQGAFRWIYGQFDTIPMELSRNGKLLLTGNLQTGEDTLEVNGDSSFNGDVNFDGVVTTTSELTVGGDLNVLGELTFNSVSIGDTITAPSIEITNELVVGGNPESGGTGTIINGDGTAQISNSLRVADVLIDNSGIIQSSGSISAPNASFPTATITTLNSDSITSPGFQVTGGNTTIDNLTVNNFSGTIPDISITGFDAEVITAETANITNGNFTSVTSDTVNCTTITGTDANFNTLTVGEIIPTVITYSGPLETSTLRVKTVQVNAAPGAAGTEGQILVDDPVRLDDDLIANGDINGASDKGVRGFGEVISGLLQSTDNVFGFNNLYLGLELKGSGDGIVLVVSERVGAAQSLQPIGEVTLDFD